LITFRWVNTLNSNDVADRIIDAVRKNEKFTLIPKWFCILLAVKW
jgi:all-trans-retinol dehydrogenase (NAD+)